MRTIALVLALLATSLHAASTKAEQADPAEAKQEWGDLCGEFIYDGTPPEPSTITRPRQAPIADESLLVDAKTGAVANIVVYMQSSAANPVRPIHPDYEKTEVANADVKLNVLATFEPRIVLLRTSQKLVVQNQNAVGFDLRIDSLRNREQYQLMAAGKSATFVCRSSESLPCLMSSSINPWFRGFVVVQDHPYMAKSDAQGRFEIKNVPVGKWTFRLWHEQTNFLAMVWRAKKAERLTKGRLEVDIRPGQNDLGQILVGPNLFFPFKVPVR